MRIVFWTMQTDSCLLKLYKIRNTYKTGYWKTHLKSIIIIKSIPQKSLASVIKVSWMPINLLTFLFGYMWDAGGLSIMQIFPWMDNGDAEFLVWKTAVLMSSLMYLDPSRWKWWHLMLYCSGSYPNQDRQSSIFQFAAYWGILFFFFSGTPKRGPILISCLLQWVIEAGGHMGVAVSSTEQ